MDKEITENSPAAFYKNKSEDLPATFIGQSITKIVQGRSKWKVKNYDTCSAEDNNYLIWLQENNPKELTQLEELYKEFCRKAYKIIASHPSNNGVKHPYRIIIPDLYFEIIPTKFPVK